MTLARRKRRPVQDGLPPKVRPRPPQERDATNLRKEAAHRTCQIRIPGICNPRPDDCVLCHAQTPAGIRGMGQKAPDLLGAWGCSACHDEYDRRTRHVDADFARICFYEGVLRTQNILIKEKKVKW
jgi:hypothetical protein